MEMLRMWGGSREHNFGCGSAAPSCWRVLRRENIRFDNLFFAISQVCALRHAAPQASIQLALLFPHAPLDLINALFDTFKRRILNAHPTPSCLAVICVYSCSTDSLILLAPP